MTNLEKLIRDNKRVFLSGPYGTMISERARKGELPNRLKKGCGCASLEEPLGIGALLEIGIQYLLALPEDQAIALMTSSFRLDSKTMQDKKIESGLALLLSSIDIAEKAINQSGRSEYNTPIAVSIGPPHDCYNPNPEDVADIDILAQKYLPQVLPAVRDKRPSYLIGETIPIKNGVKALIKAYSLAHFEIESPSPDVRRYFGNSSRVFELLGANQDSGFAAIDEEKGYVPSLFLDPDGNVNGEPLGDVIKESDDYAAKDGIVPTGYGINCTAYEPAKKGLKKLLDQEKERIIELHLNANPNEDPDLMDKVDPKLNFKPGVIAGYTHELATDNNILIVGGCCGTDPVFLTILNNLFEVNKSSQISETIYQEAQTPKYP